MLQKLLVTYDTVSAIFYHEHHKLKTQSRFTVLLDKVYNWVIVATSLLPDAANHGICLFVDRRIQNRKSILLEKCIL